ncbi:MAG: DNA polymerase/3'-5' exonuclease PolX [Candidatus Sulfobium sp.]
MPIHNSDIADIFNEIADLLEIQGANQFRIRAYRNAARTVGELSQSVADMVKNDEDLSRLAGVGKDLAGKMVEIVETGTLSLLAELKTETPEELSGLMKIQGLGPKKVKALHRALGIRTLEDLKKAAMDEKIRGIAGFGEKTEKSILEEVEQIKGVEQRIKLVVAEQIAEPFVDYLKKGKGVKEIAVAGSYRRRRETVGDLDILATAADNSDIMDRFVHYEDVAKVISEGTTRSTVQLRSGLHVDLRVVPQESYGAALHYFTGSKAHNIAVRTLGVKKKLKINEYGVFRGRKRIAGKTEEEVYRQVDLPFIPPELREDRGEVEAARDGSLPSLVTLDDVRGDLHVHTSLTDGRASLEQMVEAAKKKGYEYVAITEHSKHVTVARGLKARDVIKRNREIDRLNSRLHGITVLKSIELDILDDGSLDLPDEVLEELDLVVCSVHYKFNLSRDKQTERVIRAMDNPYFGVFSHPTGRLINERRPYELDMEKVMRAARERGCFMELNSHPDRLDLNDMDCKMAKDTGVKVSISTDAHSTNDLDFMRFGIGQARRGWLERKDVLNTRSLSDLRKLLERK